MGPIEAGMAAGKDASPYSSFHGFPNSWGVVVSLFFLFIILKLWLSLRKDRINQFTLYKENEMIKSSHQINDIIQHGFIGRVVKIHHGESPSYDVDFQDEDGNKITRITVEETDIVKS